jgi:predicted ATPase
VRAARAQDFRRRLRERVGDWILRLERFSFAGIPSLGAGDIPFLSPLTIISGPNGVGKTTLLRAIWAATNPDDAMSTRTTAQKLPSGTATLSFLENNAPKTSHVVLAPGSAEGGVQIGVEVLHLDSASEIAIQQDSLCSFTNIDDLINGVGSKTLDGKALETINYIARRDYRDVKVYEVETGDHVTPFFEVAMGNDRYDSRTMGAGELAAFFLWWSIARASENALILIEEPECYLSPASQAAFCNFLIAAIVEKHLTVVATSHSPQIISGVSDENLVFVFRNTQGIKIVDGAPPPALLEMIGIAPQVDTIVLVEDLAASSFCRFLLEKIHPSLSRRVEISVRDGDGNIVRALKEVGGNFSSLNVIGLFDGDLIGQIPKEVLKFSTLLPGDQPIEVVFRGMIEGEPEALQKALGAENLEAILFGLRGSNHHDWYDGLCRQLGLTKAQLFPTLVQLWLRRDEKNLALAQTMVESIIALRITAK